jgi:hypothetical protein
MFADVAQSAQDFAMHCRTLKFFPGRGTFQSFPQSSMMIVPSANEEIKIGSSIL